MSFPDLKRATTRRRVLFTCSLLLASSAVVTAHADLPEFLQHVIGASTVESALYRLMHTASADVLYPRPPAEATRQLTALVAAAPAADLFALRARSEEQQMDYPAAEADWKRFTTESATAKKDAIAAKQELADYYERRQQIPEELAVLAEIAAAPAPADQTFLDPSHQRPWLASVRSLYLVHEQALPAPQEDAVWNTFLTRYPTQPGLYARYLNVLLDRADYPAAEALIARLRTALPADLALQMQAQAALLVRRGDAAGALALYDRAFNPLWPAPVLENYFALLNHMHRAHGFLADAQARLAANPDDLDAAVRIFLFFQQGAGSAADAPTPHPAAAREALARFRISKEARHAAWTPTELYTLASLSRQVDDWPEAARYDYALAAAPGNLAGGEPAAQAGLAALTSVLLTAPDQPIALGSGNLAQYRDIATLDSGPGYWNGILSLWLNGTSPAGEYATESAKAQPYFHRAAAADLLARLDREFPAAPERPALHLQMLQAAAQYGDPAATVAGGRQFLAAFPQAPGRLQVAMLTADAYARQKDLTSEFALYDTMLAELAARAKGQPLSAAAQPAVSASPAPARRNTMPDVLVPAEPVTPPTPQTEASAEYAELLDRYLARLTATNHLPEALAVLRRQLDLNPGDPKLYERLATFLQQNNLSAQQEAVYKLAIARFPGTSWSDKLGRFYLKQKRSADFSALTRQVTGIFSGTELDAWFEKVSPGDASVGPALALQLNLYAAGRFPHDLVFTRNLITAYTSKPTANPAVLDALLRHHWWESPELRDRFFEHLAQTGALDRELAALDQPGTSPPPDAKQNPAALREQAEALLWLSRFEQATPLMNALSAAYPADADLGDRTVSLFRSLSYEEPTQTAHAVAVERRLLAAEPDSPNRLATLGDLYAEATASGGEDLASAAPFWRRIPQLHPGSPAGYLTSATVFWDYFQFDDALNELAAARQRFAAPALFGYETGAIQENRRDLAAAVREYILAIVQPPDPLRRVDSFIAVLQAAFTAPSDAADSNFVSTAVDFYGSDLARARLLELARRPSTATLVDQATAQAVTDHPGTLALTLRADVLGAQSREAELAPTLSAALARTQTPEQAEAVGALARSHSLVAVYEAALEREASLTPDTVEKIQLHLALARSQEDRRDLPAASRTIAQVYAANPRLLGVVRTTVDFYTRTHQPKQAVVTLLEAARAATPQLAQSFTLEAATDANKAGDTAQARTLALQLLQTSPYDARYLAVVADSYSRAHDDAGLKTFYLARLDAARNAPPAERKADTALLRRGLIPALTRLDDPASAEEQYLALIAAYPEDANTADQAALYALSYGREAQVLTFLQKAVADSPRDSRFSILLARAETTFGDLPAASAAYSAAIAVRSDRADLYTARADLELRLADNDPSAPGSDTHLQQVARDYIRLYTLTYHDPSWMTRLAALRARQGRPADAVQALQAAWITGQPQTGDVAVANLFKVAERLEHWNFLPEARTFAERGRTLAGPAFLTGSPSAYADTSSAAEADEETAADQTDSDQTATAQADPVQIDPDTPADASLYARILVRQGHAEEALTTLVAARREAQAASPALLATLFNNLADGDSPEARQDLTRKRRAAIQTGFARALTALGSNVGTYATPEGKVRFAAALDAQHTASPRETVAAAHAAGLLDREALWRRQALLASAPNNRAREAYVSLQNERLQFAELAQTLELYSRKLKPEQARAVLVEAAEAYRAAGDPAAELRLTRPLALAANPALRVRFLDLLLARDPAALEALASGKDASLANDAANYAIAHGSASQAITLVRARGRTLGTVWTMANEALTGLSFASTTHAFDPATDSNFQRALGAGKTIGDRLASSPTPAQQLGGEQWFPYAASYAVFRFHSPGHGDPEDFAAAALEQSLTRIGPAYTQLAQTYDEAGKTDAALGEYAHALELDPANAATLDAEATMLARAGRTSEALTAWRSSLDTLARQAGRNSVPDSFWTGFSLALQHLKEHGLTAQFLPRITSTLRLELTRNGNYRSSELLQKAFASSASPAEGTALVLAATSGIPQEAVILADLSTLPLRTDAAGPVAKNTQGDVLDQPHERILERRIELARQHRSATPDTTDPSATTPAQLVSLQTQLIQLMLDLNQLASAAALQATLDPEADPPAKGTLIQVSTRQGQLQPLLDRWTSDPESAPTQDVVAAAFSALQRPTPFYRPQPAQLRPLLDYIFERKRRDNSLDAADYLALAQNHLDSGDLPGAIALLHALKLQPPLLPNEQENAAPDALDPAADADAAPAASRDTNPLANLDAAAHLLVKANRPADAVPFLQLLARNAPWNSGFRLRLAQAEFACGQSDGVSTLQTVAADPQTPYPLRIVAAQTLAKAGAHPASLGSGELDLLAAGKSLGAAAAQKPYFAAARVAASADNPEALLREAIAIDPQGRFAPDARLRLLTLLLTSGNPAQALPVLRTSSSRSDPDADPSEDAQSSSSVALPGFARTQPLSAQVRLATGIARAYRQAGDLAEAESWLQLALDLNPIATPEEQHALIRQIRQLRQALALRQQNAARRPVLRDALGDPLTDAPSAPVRPRLVAAASVPAPTPSQEAP